MWKNQSEVAWCANDFMTDYGAVCYSTYYGINCKENLVWSNVCLLFSGNTHWNKWSWQQRKLTEKHPKFPSGFCLYRQFSALKPAQCHRVCWTQHHIIFFFEIENVMKILPCNRIAYAHWTLSQNVIWYISIFVAFRTVMMMMPLIKICQNIEQYFGIYTHTFKIKKEKTNRKNTETEHRHIENTFSVSGKLYQNYTISTI